MVKIYQIEMIRNTTAKIIKPTPQHRHDMHIQSFNADSEAWANLKDELAPGMYNSQYKKLFKSYCYRVLQLKYRINQTSPVEYSDFRWIGTGLQNVTHMEILQFKNEVRIVIINDTEIYTFSDKGALINMQGRKAYTKIRNDHSSLMIISDNKIGFLRQNGSISNVYCRAGHESKLVDAATDGMSSGHVYGLTDTGLIYVFRTSNLLITTDPTECQILTKIQIADSGHSLYSIKGGLLVKRRGQL